MYAKYRVYCETEGMHVETTGFQTSAPTQCPNNAGHTITTTLTALVERAGVGNHGAAADPTVSEDGPSGYAVGDKWWNTATSDEFVLMDDAAGAAVWVRTTEPDPNSIHDNVAGEIAAVTEKTTPVSGDWLLIEDSAASNAKKRIQVGNLPGGGGAVALAGVQARKTSNQSSTASFVDIDFPTTDIENDNTKVDHDATTDRIVVKETGLYEVAIQGVVHCSQVSEGVGFRLRINDTTVVAGSEFSVIGDTDHDEWLTATSYSLGFEVYHNGRNYICTAAHTSAAGDEPGVGTSWSSYWDISGDFGQIDIPFYRRVLVSLSANDFLTWQMDNASLMNYGSLQASNYNSVFTVTSLVGVKGAQGPAGAAGAAGADGDITWQGAWATSTAYTTNQAVEHNGSSYVCILNHTASASDEPGVGGSWTTYWDLMASKGDVGNPVFGSEAHNVEDNTLSSTTSGTYVLKMSLTTASIPAGDYMIMWTAEQSTDKASGAVSARVQIDDTTTLLDSTAKYSSAGDFHLKSGYCVCTLSAGVHTIDLDHKCGSGPGEGSNVKNARIALWRFS